MNRPGQAKRQEKDILIYEEPTPKQVVQELDRYVVGQDEAKRAVAIALRNRVRRRRLPPEMQEEVYPKNIIMIGPTGVGKTEIARRLSRMVDAPFHKVEASKFTEVGYVGRDVESIIRDVVEISVNRIRAKRTEELTELAERNAEEKILDQLVPSVPQSPVFESETQSTPSTREKFREKLRAGELEDRVIEPEFEESPVNIQMHAIGIPPGMGAGLEEAGSELKNALERMFPKKKNRRTTTVAESRPLLVQQELDHLIDMEAIVRESLEKVEQTGIIFIDELDKIVGKEGGAGPDVSREGVQRDLLPIVEGSTVFTKYGPVKTDHILFIAAGAFHGSKPSDLVPELQGRFPIRVELDALGKGDFQRILTEPKNSLIRQYTELLATDGVTLFLADDAVEAVAELAWRMNEQTENIGARRLHTIMEKLVEDISFEAPDTDKKEVKIDAEYVRQKLEPIVEDTDLSRYIL
jgi:ATP-dependent HslUV protease ATP-binding subunit HslU